MKEFLLKNKFLHITLVFFTIFTIWWLILKPFNSGVLLDAKEHWSVSYWIFAVFGGLVGIMVSKRFGYSHSIIGGAVLAFSVGLFLQALGQMMDSYYSFITGFDVIYPSFSEIGYTGSIFAYIYGSFLLAKYVVSSNCFKSPLKIAIVWLIPVVMFAFSYFSYLTGYDFDNTKTIQIILDFSYPILQSIYVALAVFVLFRSRCIQGGVLRQPIAFLVCALILQYVADSYFVYEFNRGVWYSGNLNDYIYFFAYFILVLSIIYLDDTMRSLSEKPDTLDEPAKIMETEGLHSTYVTLLQAIIRSQEEIIGPLAWTEVAQIKNILVKDKTNVTVEIVENPKETIDALLDKFFKVFGPTALYVAKRNTYRITKNMPMQQIPEKLL